MMRGPSSADPSTPVDSRNRNQALVAAVWAGLLVFLTAGYFQNSRPGWGVNSQFALACAIGERATLRIDAYHDLPATATGDKAYREGHLYSDKSPVTAMLGAPVVWVCRQWSQAHGTPFSYDSARYWATWIVAGGAAAFMAAGIVLLLIARGVGPTPAAIAGALWICATPLLGYSVLFTNYLPAAALAVWGLICVQHIWLDSGQPTLAWRLGVGGLLLGLSSWTLNTMALSALALTCLILPGLWIRRDKLGRRGASIQFACWCVGGMLGIVGYFAYLWAAFGSFQSPYRWEADPFFRDQMAQGLMGATQPRAFVAWLVTFHPFQGLFLWWPITFLALIGLARMASCGSSAERGEGISGLAVFLVLLIYVSGYFMWWGGWAYAPRHLLAAMPLLAPGIAPWLRNKRLQWVFLGVAALSLAPNIAAVSVDPQIPPGYPNPLSQDQLMQPHTVEDWPTPYLTLQHLFWQAGAVDLNWGRQGGLEGVSSLAPLALIWIVAFLLLFAFNSRLNRSTAP